MSTHPTFNPNTGPSVAYTPKTTDESDGTINAAGVVPHVNPQTNSAAVAAGNPLPTAEVGSSLAAAGISSQTGNGPAVVGKNSQGNHYHSSAQNTSAVAGWLALLDLAAVPAAGAAIAPKEAQPLPATVNGVNGFAQIEFKPPTACANGVVVVMTTSLTNYTPSTMAGWMSVSAR